MLIRLLRTFLRRYRGTLLIVLALQSVQALANLYLPTLNADIIDRGVVRADSGYIWRIGGIMLVVSVAQLGFSLLAVYFGSRAAMAFGRDVRSALFHRVTDFSAQEVNTFGAPSLINRITNDVQQVQLLVVMTCTLALAAPITAVGGVIMAMRQDIGLSWLLAISMPALLISVALVISRMVPQFRLMQERIDNINRVLREQIIGIRVVRAFVREPQETGRFDDVNTELTATSLAAGRLMAVMFPIVLLIINGSSVALIWIGGSRIAHGQTSIGSLIAFLTYFTLILTSVMMGAFVGVMAPRAAVCAERIQEVLDTETSVKVPVDPRRDVTSVTTIEFQGVTFSYPRAEAPVLCDVTFRTAAGTTTAIIGSTGSGKTTLINLVARLFDVTDGTVLAGGADVRDIAPEVLWDRIGLVPQKPYLFSGTVRSNLLYGKPNASDDDLWTALRVAQAADFVALMPGGLDAVIEQGGTNVSGGQRQRLAIARALVRQPDVYLFDDSFSALDLATDARLRAALVPYTRYVAVLIVAQRVSTIRDADQILVLEGGRIVGAGTHGELLETCPTYIEIVDSQTTDREAAVSTELDPLRQPEPAVPAPTPGPAPESAPLAEPPHGPPVARPLNMRMAPGMPRMGAVGMPVEKSENFWLSMRRLLTLLRRHQIGFLLVIGLAVASVTLSVLGPRILGHATDIIFTGLVHGGAKTIDFRALHRTLLTVVGLYIGAAGLSYIQAYLLAGIVQRTMYRLRDDVESKLNRLPLRYIDEHSRGDLLSRVTNDIDNLAQSLQQTLSQILTSTLTLTGTLVMMYVVSWQLALLATVTIPTSIVTIRSIAKRSRERFTRQWAFTGRLNGLVEEAFTGHAIVKAFGRQREVEERFRVTNDELFDASFGAQFISGSIQPSMTAIGNLNFVGIAVIGGLRVASKAMTLGGVQAFIQYSRQFTQPLTQLASMANVFQSGVVSAERIFEFLDADEQSPDPTDLLLASPVRGRVEFEHVSFSYDPNRPLITDLSLVAEPGRTVAIVGPTGAGKTTLVNLIMRFYELDAGRITLDGTDIAALSRAELRSKIGMVLQDTWLFGGTIRDNIAYGNPGSTEEQIREAARATFVDRFVHSLPRGYDTLIDDEEGAVSAGEKQLLTIARAFLADPAILILDEATSSVDTRTEVLIQHAMAALRSQRTSFVIAHRLSTIRDADTILVMENGRIVEQGDHDQLLAANGAYARLYNAEFAAPAAEVT